MVLALSFYSCDTDDDGPNVAYEVAEITAYELPEYFETGEDYEIEVTYELADACHTFAGFEQGPSEDEDDEDVILYYIHALSSYDPNLIECNEEGELTETRLARNDFRVASNTEYTTVRFMLLRGVSSTNESDYITVDVPIGEPEDETPEENTNE
ncbi:hypothetical protein J0871_04770 [Salegentibacter sp. BDJ18]|nr:hypothetical protein [Salegentibacter sp. BDJ18]MBO2543723.1 hypothetical protein [Salegentibacter sp. BDJ18]